MALFRIRTTFQIQCRIASIVNSSLAIQTVQRDPGLRCFRLFSSNLLADPLNFVCQPTLKRPFGYKATFRAKNLMFGSAQSPQQWSNSRK